MLKFYVHGQRLRMETAVVASDTIDYLTAQFLFQTDDWKDTARTAVFRGAGETYSVLLTDDHIRAEDHLNLPAGEWTVHVIGTVSGESGTTRRITTTQVRFMVDDCGAVDGSAFPEVPVSYGEQVLAAAQAAVATANGVKEAADAGAFKGEKGDTGAQGPKGDKGDTGPQGPKGDTGDTGAQGPQGEKGEKGDAFTYADFTAAQLTALKGEKGDTGATGPQGPKGDTGETGPQGPKGDTGATGPKGDKGDTGLKGDKGDNGDPGIVISATQPTAESHPVWINPEGGASPAGGTDLSLGVTGATVGQIAKITAVDDSGKPTAWEAADMPSGGGGSGETWEAINAITLSDAVNTVTINTDSGGNAIALKKVRILVEGSATHNQDLFFNNSRYIRAQVVGTAASVGVLSAEPFCGKMYCFTVPNIIANYGFSNQLANTFSDEITITEIKLIVNNSGTFSAGTKFTIQGVRA